MMYGVKRCTKIEQHKQSQCCLSILGRMSFWTLSVVITGRSTSTQTTRGVGIGFSKQDLTDEDWMRDSTLSSTRISSSGSLLLTSRWNSCGTIWFSFKSKLTESRSVWFFLFFWQKNYRSHLQEPSNRDNQGRTYSSSSGQRTFLDSLKKSTLITVLIDKVSMKIASSSVTKLCHMVFLGFVNVKIRFQSTSSPNSSSFPSTSFSNLD